MATSEAEGHFPEANLTCYFQNNKSYLTFTIHMVTTFVPLIIAMEDLNFL